MSKNKWGDQSAFGFGGGSESSSKKFAPSCHESHGELKLGTGVLRGGSCYSPKKGYDVYLSLQTDLYGNESYPWEAPVELHYRIDDQGVPKTPARFKKLVTYLCTQLQDGKRVHVGCIGGHGRTGLVIAAIYAEMSGDKDAIQWVRKNHCKKAVESSAQIKFLMEHFGCSTAEPRHRHAPLKFSSREDTGFGAGEPWIDDARPTPPYRAPKEKTVRNTLSLEEYLKQKKLVQPALATTPAAPPTNTCIPDLTSKKSIWS